jgi:hypothetical protein
MTLVVKRSAVRMWLLAMAGIPLLVISLDVLTNRRLTNWLRELIFRPEDTQIFEPRDVIWAWVMVLFAGFLVLWGLKELFLPTKVLEARDDGLVLKINGPFRPASLVPWGWIVDVRSSGIDDEGTQIPLLAISLATREGLPANPWGARWLDERELGLIAEDWSTDPEVVSELIGNFAVDAARRNARARTASVWGRSSFDIGEEE